MPGEAEKTTAIKRVKNAEQRAGIPGMRRRRMKVLKEIEYGCMVSSGEAGYLLIGNTNPIPLPIKPQRNNSVIFTYRAPRGGSVSAGRLWPDAQYCERAAEGKLRGRFCEIKGKIAWLNTVAAKNEGLAFIA